MSYLATPRETGYFSAAFRITESVGAIAWPVVSAGFPIVARAAGRDPDRLRYALQRLFEVSLILGVWMTVLIVIGAQFAIDVVAGPGFQASVSALRIQGLAVITAFLAATWGLALLSLKAYRALLVGNALALVVAAVVTVLLVPGLGADGGAAATVAAETTLVLAYLVGLVRARPNLRPSLAIVPKVGLAAAASLAPALLSLHPVIKGAIASVVFFAVMFALKGVPPELLAAVRDRKRTG